MQLAGSLVGAFVAGVVVHRYVISEATSIKAHTTAEIQEVRADLADLVKKLAAKL
jgi:hypothetical protein